MLVTNLETKTSSSNHQTAFMNPGTFIILNGASSSGKSSLLKELQNTLDEPYLNAGLD